MPVRFQVDPDFYDHPKTTGMSDAAFALWVRAGSYSAAKLTDGFVSEDVLVYTLRSDVEVAEELVRRGLWRRRKGGFTFHQWGDRNLTRERVETDRNADRKRKQQARKSAKTQATTQNVRPDTTRTPTGHRTESTRNPAVSVSESVYVSVSGSGHAPPAPSTPAPDAPQQTRPADRCPTHTDDPDPPACGQCADARRAAEAWDAERPRRDAAARSAEARRRAELRAAEIAACRMCDGDGYAGARVCDHDPQRVDVAARGSAAVRAALAERRSA